MRLLLGLALLAAGCHRAPAPAPASEDPPAWAYVVAPESSKPPPDDGGLLHVPDSTLAVRPEQMRSRFFAPDWHPEDHPPIPDVVARGRPPDVWACGTCHRADGSGGPENASLAGLPADYMLQQITDFVSGHRKNVLPGRLPQTWMAHVAEAARPDEIDAAISYFASLKPRADIRVVETDVVPETAVAQWTLAETKSGRTEPIGRRIIEVPEDLEQFENLDGRSRFVAYVPDGSLARGQAIATAGIPGTAVASCTSCHMADLRGVHFIPPLAGRSPSYAIRQLWDMKVGARTGPGLPPMARVAQALDLDAMIAVAAYVASLPP